jgi:23S rRNA pseudouridine955/2504/2580 synthase
MREIVVGTNETPKRIENFLKREFPIGYIRKLFRKNGLRINGRRAMAKDLIRAGDRIQLYIPFEPEKKIIGPIARADKLDVVFEDDTLLVVNKPAGLAVHEGKTIGKRESLLGLVENRYRDSAITPKLVHRLDRDTSGLLVIAKNLKSAAALVTLFESGAVGKEYLCLVVGRLPFNDGRIDFPLPGREGQPVHALTCYRVLKRLSETTLVRVTIETGRLHQIRLHFAKLGYPVVMDDQHGDFGFNKRFRKEFGLKRQFLHAERLKIRIAGKQRAWTAPLAKDLRNILDLLSDEK